MSSHHATVVLVDNPAIEPWIVSDNCELSRFDYEKIGIDEIRSLINEAHRLPAVGKQYKEIVLSGFSITREAEQAALKILEEPPLHVRIVLILPSGTHLLDTVLSRVERIVRSQIDEPKRVLSEWLTLNPTERIAEIEIRLKNKDLSWMHALRSELLHVKSTDGRVPDNVFEDVSLIIDNLLTRGASNKMLLEHLALSLPVTK